MKVVTAAIRNQFESMLEGRIAALRLLLEAHELRIIDRLDALAPHDMDAILDNLDEIRRLLETSSR